MKIIVCLLTFVLSSSLFATAKTLPKGLWSLSMYQEDSSIEKAGVNPANDETTWIHKDVNEIVLNDLPNFQAFSAVPGIDLNTKMVEWWDVNRFHWDLAYGITNKLTAFANIAYDSSRIRFTDGFIQQMAIARAASGGQVPYSPRYMKAYHLSDTFVGLKYNIVQPWSFTLRGTFGPFKTGRDDIASREIDFVKEIPTGTVYDQYEFYTNYDFNIGKVPFRFMYGFIHKNEGYQNFFDNRNVKMDLGDLHLLSLGADYKLSKKWESRFDVTYIHAGADQVETNGQWRYLPASQADLILAKVGVTYAPAPFIHIFTDAFIPLQNDLNGKLYDSPGRLEPGWNFQYGVRLFYM